MKRSFSDFENSRYTVTAMLFELGFWAYLHLH